MLAETLKKQLVRKIDQLPEECLRQVADFIGYLLTKKQCETFLAGDKALDPKQDPILDLIGIADMEPFSQKIDEELYGH